MSFLLDYSGLMKKDSVIKGTLAVKKNLAQMLKGGVIMDVTNAEQARIAEKAGAVAVMALERVPADIRAQGGVARMSDPKLIKEIQNAVSIPVMAKVRIGHVAEAQILEALKVDFIDESEVLTPADTQHVQKSDFQTPFVCGATNLGEALRRIQEGAAMIRTKGEAGTGDVIEAVRHLRCIYKEIETLKKMTEAGLKKYALQERVMIDMVKKVQKEQKLPVVNFAAGGIATPADAAFLMQIGAEGVFVGSGIFKSASPAKRARAIVLATMNYQSPQILAKISEDLDVPMFGIQAHEVEVRLQERGKTL